jgi:hypothetical protein
MFQSFYVRHHELINVAFMFDIVDGIAKSLARHEILLFHRNG